MKCKLYNQQQAYIQNHLGRGLIVEAGIQTALGHRKGSNEKRLNPFSQAGTDWHPSVRCLWCWRSGWGDSPNDSTGPLWWGVPHLLFAACGVSPSARCCQTDNIGDLHFIIREGSRLKMEDVLAEEKRSKATRLRCFGLERQMSEPGKRTHTGSYQPFLLPSQRKTNTSLALGGKHHREANRSIL